MSYSITSRVLMTTSKNDHDEKKAREFSENLSKVINEHIVPKYGMNLKFSIQLGLWTSDEYGSYKISFFNEEEQEVCYIIADIILGEWKLNIKL